MNIGIIRGGAGLVWRRQSVLWWIFAVNLLLALAGTLPMASRTGAILNNSLESAKLVHGMDLPALAGLAMDPSHPLSSGMPALGFAVVFFVFMLFIEGGVLEVYRLDRKLTRAEFFGACGTFFWRFARLVLYSLILLIPIFLAAQFVINRSGKLARDAAPPMAGFWFEAAGLVIVLFLLMAVRLWFDLAQVDAVREDERAMRRGLRRAARAMRGHFWRLFWVFFRISLAGWVFLAAAFWVWVRHVRPESIRASCLLSQAVLLVWLGTRLWQRASETLWYERQSPLPAPAPSTPELSPAQPSTLEPGSPEPSPGLRPDQVQNLASTASGAAKPLENERAF
ncbi:MAG TPA: hypothetical protein VG204_04900 [Terriglobia bacterium]|nr:hypothetical protein [Terriglobia bacterium]